ncbi:MAG: TetR/AcrR family transcriptional regulator [Lachnospiraceae bacterium]|nr:TetR/AcrR family transcriptional regulator [Lachnospiraceae bacterium]
MEQRERIINAAIDEFESKGLKFTMDDVAKRLYMSKKTLYTVFKDKEEMLLAVADYCFAEIKRSEQEVLNNSDLDTVDKIRQIIVVMPERYQNIGLNNLYQLKDKYPGIYKRVENYLETDWDATIYLLEKGMEEGKIRKASIPVIKGMVESTIAHFMSSGVLVDNGLSYEEGLNEMIDIIMKGLVV